MHARRIVVPRSACGLTAFAVPHVRRQLVGVALVALSLAALHVDAKVVHVVEYHHAGANRHHVTSVSEEIDKLDTGLHGWVRTGAHFRANDTHVNGTAAVCRYYLPKVHGDTHFLSASRAECARVHAASPQFVHESDAVMYIALPDASTGACGANTLPVYRLWNRQPDTHHRYVTSVATRDQLIAQGWVAEGYGQDPVAMCTPKDDVEPDPVTASLPPACKGSNPNVAVPGKPHGMYVWSPSAPMVKFLAQSVIGIDPTLCGASLVIPWSSVETANGVYDWSAVTTAALPFTSKGLTVNLLFAEASESLTGNTVTPAWVFAPVSSGGAGAASVTCGTYPQMPVYFDPAYEAAWTAFIAAAINQFSYGNSALAPSVGYMRFATGGGAEALLPPGLSDGGVCQNAWTAAGYTYAAWNQHEARIISAMGSVATDKQVIASLGTAPGGPSVYDVSNQSAAVAAPKGIGFSFENLGVAGVATAGTTPAACNPSATIANLHWCQAYTTYVGQVPFAMQPITATTTTGTPNSQTPPMDIGTLLNYALRNNIQIFELYAEEWLTANPSCWPGYVAANQARYQQALQAAAKVLGATGALPPPPASTTPACPAAGV